MTKKDIINAIAVKTAEREKAKVYINAFLQEVRSAIKRGDRMDVRGFGNFVPRTTAPKIGRNMKTKTSILIPERRTVKFKVSKNFFN